MMFKGFLVMIVTLCALMLVFLIVAEVEKAIKENREAKKNDKEKT